LSSNRRARNVRLGLLLNSAGFRHPLPGLKSEAAFGSLDISFLAWCSGNWTHLQVKRFLLQA